MAGVDEVGRGPLAGPVVAAAVVLVPGVSIEGAADSKRLSAAMRERVFEEILRGAAGVAVGAASVREIDRMNVLKATALAMRRALARLPEPPGHVVVDGLPMRSLGCAHHAVVDGDALIHSIGCASIVAKVVRDRLMRRLATRHPGYGWEHNAGYGTAEHMDGLRSLGTTAHHRELIANQQLDLGLLATD
ncbi:MAG: ribonuclease HII [Gemmatimonadetes bacterium]|nr:ribonuclease HII [Gemmatimonadota bacterium]